MNAEQINGDGGAPKKNRAAFYLRLGGTLLTLLLLFWLLRSQGWDKIGAAFQRIPVWRLWAALAVTLLSRCAVTLRWHVLLRSARIPVRLEQSARITFAGLFAANFLPTTVGGDVVRLAACVPLRLDAAVSAASLVVDRLIGMAGMAIALPVGLARLAQVGLPTPGKTYLPDGIPHLLSLAAGGWAGKLWQKGLDFARRILGSFKLWLAHPGGLLLSLLATCLHQLCLYTSIWLLLGGMGETVSWVRIAGIWSLVYFLTLLPISINGYGLQETFITLLYAHLGGFSPEASVTLALLFRIIQMAVSLPGALFVPGILAAARSAEKRPA